MYKKIKELKSKFFSGLNFCKSFLVIFIISSILLILFVTEKQKWPQLFIYPEKIYQDIEDEAYRMAYTHNFDTDYECTYTYNNKTNKMSLNLSDVTGSASITVDISNYNTDKQNICITRDVKTKGEYIYINFISYFFFLPLLLATSIEFVIFVISDIAISICFVFHKIRLIFSNKK